jgi:hypothetical protein
MCSTIPWLADCHCRWAGPQCCGRVSSPLEASCSCGADSSSLTPLPCGPCHPGVAVDVDRKAPVVGTRCLEEPLDLIDPRRQGIDPARTRIPLAHFGSCIGSRAVVRIEFCPIGWPPHEPPLFGMLLEISTFGVLIWHIFCAVEQVQIDHVEICWQRGSQETHLRSKGSIRPEAEDVLFRASEEIHSYCRSSG